MNKLTSLVRIFKEYSKNIIILNINSKNKQMKDYTVTIRHNGFVADVTLELFDNIVKIVDEFWGIDSRFCKEIEFFPNSYTTLKKYRNSGKKKINPGMKDFIEKSFKHILNSKKDLLTFHSESNQFEKINNITPNQFISNGIYYGVFCKPIENSIIDCHFILKIENKKITVWSRNGSNKYYQQTGELEYSDSKFFAVLKYNYSNISSFIIGNKSIDPKQKDFIATWSTHDNEIFSAYCKIFYVEDSKYSSLVSIENAKENLHDVISKKIPTDVMMKLRNKPYSFINNNKIEL